MTQLASDTFTGSNGASWSATWTTGQNPTSGGSALIQSNKGRLTGGNVAGTYQGNNRISRKVNISAPTDAVALFSFTWPTAVKCYPRFYIRSTNTNLDTQGGYWVEFNPDTNEYFMGRGTGYSNFSFPSNTSYPGSGDAKAKTWVAGNKYWCRFGVVGSLVQMRVWDDGSPEPGTWDISVTNTALATAGSGCGITMGAGSTSGGGETLDIDDFVLDDAFPSGASVSADSAPTITVGTTATASNARLADTSTTLTVGRTATVTSAQGADAAATTITVGRSANAVNSRPADATQALTVGRTAAVTSARPIDGTAPLVVGTSAAANTDRVAGGAPTITLGATAVMDVSSPTFVGIDASPTLTVSRTAAVTSAQVAAATTALTVGRIAAVELNRPIDGTSTTTVGTTAGAMVDGVVGGTAPLTLSATSTASKGQNLDATTTLAVGRTASVVVGHSAAGTEVLTVGREANAVIARAGGGTHQTLLTATATMKVTTPEPVVSSSNGWDGLLAIYRDQELDWLRGEAERRDPVACPNDGEPLVVGPGGVKHCPYDGWEPGW